MADPDDFATRAAPGGGISLAVSDRKFLGGDRIIELDALVRRLRDTAAWCATEAEYTLMNEAAAAIEDLYGRLAGP